MDFPTPDQVKASLDVSLPVLLKDERHIVTLLKEAGNIARYSTHIIDSNSRLSAIADELAGIVGPVSACGKGCSHCCKMAVAVSSAEAALIGSAINVNPHRPTIDYGTQKAMADKFMGVPCPFLENDECSIYEHRPLPCRTHFNLSAYPVLCDVINFPGNDVPNLDMRDLWMASAHLNMHTSVFADIRDFFPEGRETVTSL